MKLSEKTIAHLTGSHSRSTRLKLALSLGYSERWIERLIQSNKQNGPLTTMAALEIIKESGLTESEVLELSTVC